MRVFLLMCFLILKFGLNAVFAHEFELPCSTQVHTGIGQSAPKRLAYIFPTHETTNPKLLSLNDGEIRVGVEMFVETPNLEFSRMYTPSFVKKGNILIGGSVWDYQKLTDEEYKRIGFMFRSTCTVLGAYNEE